jgi:hypothetical protein
MGLSWTLLKPMVAQPMITPIDRNDLNIIKPLPVTIFRRADGLNAGLTTLSATIPC